MAGIVVSGCHAQSAPAAHHQARQQRGAGTHWTEIIRPVGAKLHLIALELLARNVGRHPSRLTALRRIGSLRDPIRQEHLRLAGTR
jgi:hypothetical protein